ncbi:MAG: late competence development ComFB family protein [Pseudodesulfovibrio sp.]
MAKPNLVVRGVDLENIRNRSERRVAKLMNEILDLYYEDFIFEQLDLEDIYALTLNLLPARYVQRGTIILQDRLSDFEIKSKIRKATERVLDNPTRVDGY